MPTSPVAKTPRELKPRITKRSPSPHQAYLRGRLAAAGLIAQADIARYLASLDERAAVAHALGAQEGSDAKLRGAGVVEADVDWVLGATVSRVASGGSVLRMDFGSQLDRLSTEDRDAVTASVGLSVADAAREERGDVLTEAIAAGCAVRLCVPLQDRQRMAQQLHDVARIAYAVAQALLGQDPEAAAPKRSARRKGVA